MGDSRKSLRWMGEWRGGSHGGAGFGTRRSTFARRTVQTGMEAEADDYLLFVGWRGAGAARLDGMGRGACRRTCDARGGLHQFGHEWPRLFGGGGFARTRIAGEWRRERRDRSRKKNFRRAAAQRCGVASCAQYG